MALSRTLWIEPVSPEDKRFFQQIGTRIAELRKAQGLTQQQLADLLGLSQQMVASYEVGRRRVPISTLPLLAERLGVDLDTLLGHTAKAKAKRGPTPKLQQHMERISQLPKPKQRFVLEMLETVLAQTSR